MIGGITGAPWRWLTGPGTPTPTPWTSAAAPSARSLATRSSASWRTTFGPRRTSTGGAGVREQAQLAVGDRDVDGGGPDVDADEAQGSGEPHEMGAPPATGLREALRFDQPELDEPVELDGDLGLREPHRLAELRAGRLAAVTEQAQQTSLVAVLGAGADSVHEPPHLLEQPKVSRRLRASTCARKTSTRKSPKRDVIVTKGGGPASVQVPVLAAYSARSRSMRAPCRRATNHRTANSAPRKNMTGTQKPVTITAACTAQPNA